MSITRATATAIAMAMAILLLRLLLPMCYCLCAIAYCALTMCLHVRMQPAWLGWYEIDWVRWHNVFSPCRCPSDSENYMPVRNAATYTICIYKNIYKYKYIYIYRNSYIYIYIYIEMKRERERYCYVQSYIYTWGHVCDV